MSKLLEHKHLIHIACEIVVATGIILHNNQKCKKLMKHIEDLIQRVEDQEDMIKKHEEVIQHLLSYVNNQQQIARSQPRVNQPILPTKQSSKSSVPKPVPKPVHRNPPLEPPPEVKKPKPEVKFVKPNNTEEYQEELGEESEAELDDAIQNELNELSASDTEKEIDLTHGID